jgi:hypothetical protein
MLLIIVATTFTCVLWVAYEIWRAPMMDEDTGEIIEPAKKLSDLFKKDRK